MVTVLRTPVKVVPSCKGPGSSRGLCHLISDRLVFPMRRVRAAALAARKASPSAASRDAAGHCVCLALLLALAMLALRIASIW
jgi:hypothetical protein